MRTMATTTLLPEIDGSISWTCKTVVKACLVYFGILGTFGNVNIILATYRRKQLRTKCGILLAVLAYCDLFCLLFELLSAFRLLTNNASMYRPQCFWSIGFYIFIENIESYMHVAIGIDRLLAICFPLRYRKWRTFRYTLFITCPGVIYGAALFTMGATSLDNSFIPICNPPLAYSRLISGFWNKAEVVLCLLTVILFGAAYWMIYKIAPKKSAFLSKSQLTAHRNMIVTLTVNVVAYFVSAVCCAVLIFIMRMAHVNKDVIAEAVTYAVIPGLLSYSVNYYVYFWRSVEYRYSFRQQLFCCYGYSHHESNTVALVSQLPPQEKTGYDIRRL
ncbi:hypothetical protein QR680_015446 [Steinernema hermaphroditum]|uniref:G-protein coupled receptors family 1 profile domain-containing protein n=1 Tax=Steinernema hermaphroditum TaxID=289476 RepID=A0AA39H9X1_9BILA|nr:hypothetical protein QR680_015446 [Steinernema hermaphroditum]